MSKKARDVVDIEIYDQRYPVRLEATGERDQILKLAEVVDRRMREISRQTGTVDSLKVAILTALHLAEEAGREPGADSGLEAAVRSGAEKWIARIDEAL